MNELARTTTAIATFDGTPLHVARAGTAVPALLFIHGWTCRSAYWAPQLAHFSARHDVIVLDLPGHGASAAPREARSPALYARDVEAVAEALDLNEIILIGHSMGGAVALEAALRLQGRARGVVLVDTFVLDYGGIDAHGAEAIAAPFASDFVQAVADLVDATSTAATPVALKARLKREMGEAEPAWALPAWHALLRWDPRPAFERLRLPLAAINGDLIPASARARCAPYVQETVLAGHGHFLQMEDPDAFNVALEGVVRRMCA